MKITWVRKNRVKYSLSLLAILTFSLISFSYFASPNAYGLELFSKNETPFDIPYNVWISKYWTWWVTTTVEEATPKEGGCLVHRSDSMVMLLDPAVVGRPHQECEISSTDGIMINLWSAWNDETVPGYEKASYEKIAKGARELFNLGAVTSVVKVDGVPVAKLNEVSSMRGGFLDYKINSMANVTEIYSAGFNITVPEDTHFPEQVPGTHRAGAHGWFVFLKPLSPGDHTVYYDVDVRGTGANPHSSAVTYSLHVK